MSLAGMVTAQDYSISNKKAIKKFEKALDYYQNHQDDKALPIIDKILKDEPQFLEAFLLRSEIYHEQGDSKRELADLERIQNIDASYRPEISYFVGETYYLQANYEKALAAFHKYIEHAAEGKNLKRALYLFKCCEFAILSLENAQPIELISLGNQVNTAYNDMMPALTADENMLIFTVDIPKNPSRPYSSHNRQEDFYISYRKDGKWLSAENMGPPINTDGNEGALSISADGRIMIFASSNLPDGYGSTDLYMSTLKDGKWSTPQNLGPTINSNFWESQPSISSDGSKLYFVSNRPGGIGKTDIWYSEKDADGMWLKAVHTGNSLNTNEEENSPFIHHDGHTLYFASNGKIGMGGFDLFKVDMNGSEVVSEIMNLGAPVNTSENDEFLIINTKGNLAYLSSERAGSRNKDLYYFEIPENIRPNPVSYVSGKVFDSESNKALVATFTLVELSSGKTFIESISDEQGNYLVCLPSEKEYAFKCDVDGYLFYSDNFNTHKENAKNDPIQMDIALQPVKTGKSVILRNVFFATNEYQLNPLSELELNQLIRFLDDNPGLKIEIGGHTDNQGNALYNQTLSENRAKSVHAYLLAHGVAATRVSYHGYGMTQPIRDNNTEEGRAFNRRTEFKILSATNDK